MAEMRQDPASITDPESAEDSARRHSDNIPIPAINEELEKILASPGFAQAQRLSRFLRFIVEQLIRGEGDGLKEYPIGTAVFDKDDSFDPRTDPIVRVEAGRLRTRLKEYYAAEGRDDTVLIDLPKGSYVPIVRRKNSAVSETPVTPAQAGPNQWKAAVIVLALLLVAVAALWIRAEFGRGGIKNPQEESGKLELPGAEFLPIWRPFVSPGSRNYVVFGSPIFFASPEHNLFVRPHQINDASNLTSEPQLIALQEHLGPLVGPRYDYTLMRDALALHRLTAFLVGSGAHLSATAASETVWDSIKDGNIIFLGAPRMNPMMQHLPVQQDFEWDADQNVRNRSPLPGEQQVYATPSHETVVSYAVVASFPGLRPDREILMLAAHGGPGTQAAVDYVTRIETVRAMNEKIRLSDKGERKHYQMLLRVFVDKGAPIKAEYITHHVIP